jgi:hypothetical protein
LNPHALPPGLRLTRAGVADNEAILRFMQQHSMDAGIALRFDRSPDYFALHAAHSDDHETWLLWRNDELLGIGSFIQRQGWIDGRAESIIYLADLRFARHRAVAGLWRTLMQDILRDINSRTGASYAFCSILRANRSGRQALLNAKRADSPQLQHLRGYSNISIVARKPWAGSAAGSVLVRRARETDSHRLREFVDSQSKQTQFGPVFDRKYWQRRIDLWPNFRLEDFYLALDGSDRIAGCLAPWDSSAINRIVIEKLPAYANFMRMVCNALSPLTRRPPVRTGSDSSLPDIALTHVFVADRSAEVFAALLYAAQKDIFALRRHATISVCLYDDDPLAQALQAYWYVAVPMDLFWLDVGAMADPQHTQSSAPAKDSYPGFESYLV